MRSTCSRLSLVTQDVHDSVNLSGRPTNPFASSSPSGGPQNAIASAQQERLQRQQQRERLGASSRIQRLWRGHTSRRKTFDLWRQIWDDLEQGASGHGAYASPEESLSQLNRLMLFFHPKHDIDRLTWYGLRQMATSDSQSCTSGEWPKAYLKIVKACLAALGTRTMQDNEVDRLLLAVLGFAARRTELDQQDAISFYDTLTRLHNAPKDPLQSALVAPLQNSVDCYVGLAVLLAKPLESDIIALLRSAVDTQALATALTSLPAHTTKATRSRLWLLANVLCLAGNAENFTLTGVVARLLGSLADDVDFDSPPIDVDNTTFDIQVLSKITTGLPLNNFLHEQMTSLINQESIRNLLIRNDVNSGSGTNAQLLGGYALTLLRCFPRRADDIRMWLYLGPRSSTMETGATQYFWGAAKGSALFQSVRQSSRNVVPLIKTSTPRQQENDDWTVILVFLELYTFLLKIMDDEEFMGSFTYGKRNSAIPIADVAELVTFLKNLGFTLYFNVSELNEPGDVAPRDTGSLSLGRRNGKGAVSESVKTAESKPLTVAGLPGLTIEYLKGVTTGLLRAIYERDSRRHFLPRDHWLMTDRFDMTAFIPGVVAEEESRHTVQEQDDEDKDEESDDDEGADPTSLIRGHAGVLRSQEARARAQRKASRKRYLASVAPRLEILVNMPFFIPFTTRVEIFRQFVHLDQEKRRNGYVDPDMWRQSMMFQPPLEGLQRDPLARHHAKIRRKNEFADAYDQFYALGADLKEPIQITFVDEFDIQEAGIDGGGVTKEFLTSVISQAFDPTDPNIGQTFFVENERHLLYPNATELDDVREQWRDRDVKDDGSSLRSEIKELLKQYEFLGRIIGKCLYEGILVDVSFAGFFLKKWALTGGTNSAPMESGYRANINDLKELDEDLYKGLLAVKNAPAEDVESFGLSFTVDDLVGREGHKKVIERDLIPDGSNIAVTGENRLIYINRMSWYRLQGQSAPQTHAFLKGLSTLVQPSWLSMFNQTELQTLIGGAAAEINIADLRKNTLYGGTYVLGDDGIEHPSIQLFWSVMSSLPDVDRRKVLKFVTSTPRGPLLGFNHLNPRFSIRDSGADENRFPTTSTCVNLLKLPMYRSEGVLRERLLAAVNSGAGFDLS
nr:putative e3 ubiquitin protein ligase [Quercus suber]